MKFFGTKAFKWSFFVLALLYSFSFTTWTMWCDPYYWLCMFDFYDNAKMSFLSCLIGKLFVSVIGRSVFYTNILGWLFSLGSVLTLYFGLLKQEEWGRYLNFLSLGLILLAGWTQNMYNPDTPTLLIFSILTVIIYKCKAFSLSSVMAVGLLLGLNVLVRFPNLLAIPVVALSVFVLNKINNIQVGQNLYRVILMALIATVIPLAVWIDLNLNSTELNSFSAGQTHAISNLLNSYCLGAEVAIFKTSIIIGVVILPQFLHKNRVLKWVLPIALLGTLFLLNYWHSECLGWRPSYAYVVMAGMVYLAYKTDSTDECVRTLCFISFSLVSAAGSDTAMLKTFPYMAAFAPLVLIRYDKKYGISSYLTSVLLVITIYSVIYNWGYYKERGPYSLSDNRHMSLLVPREDMEYTNEVIRVSRKYAIDEKKVIFYGYRYSYMCYVASDSAAPFELSFWQRGTDAENRDIPKIVKYLKAHPEYSVVSTSFSIVLDNAMQKIGMQKFQSGDINVYHYGL